MMKVTFPHENTGNYKHLNWLSSEFVFKLVITAAIILACNVIVRAQAALSVTQNANSQTLAQLLAGTGVTISNYSLTCAANGSGVFTNNSSNLGVAGGVVLSSGRVQSIPQAANNFASSQFTLSNDQQLSTLTAGVIRDPCILEFDIVPQGPLLSFSYVFASEEYPEFVCSPFNDVFGFFITGPNPSGGNFTNFNIAKIPNSTLPVAINTVNPGVSGTYNGNTWPSGNCTSLSNTTYYRNNLSPVNPDIVYDGMTTVLTASSPVVPCQTYHLKLAIADVGDRIYDSGVFLSAYSFTSTAISIAAVAQLDYAGYSSAYEGCVGGSFTLTASVVQPIDMYVPIVISGTATNGVDYDSIPTMVLIPAGQQTVTIPLTPLADGITEGAETVTIAITDPCTGATSASATITIQDDIPINIGVTDSTLCASQSTQLTASGGLNYTWSPTTGLSNPNIANPIAAPDSTTTYTVNTTWGSCVKSDSVTVHVSTPITSGITVPGSSVCNGGAATITATPSGGTAPYSFLWNTGAITPDITVAIGGTYSVTTTDAYGCTSNFSQPVVIASINISGTSSDVSCRGGNDGAIDITVTGTNAPFTYAWNDGFTSQDRTNLVVGTYSVTASNMVGCSVSASYTITQPATNLTTNATNTPVSCNGGNNGTITLNANGGVAPYTYLWSGGATTKDRTGLTAGTHSVTVTDFNGCTAFRNINITQPTAINTSETHTDNICNGGNIGSIDLSASGGVPPYTYVWSNGESTQDINSLEADAYTVSVIDANSCVVTRTVTITEPSAISITLAPTDVSCFGTSSGSINTTVSGGTVGYTYSWSNGASTQNISSVAIGTYTITVADANSCSASASAELTQPEAALSVSLASTNINCNGENDGTITATPEGGTLPYSYNWSNGGTMQTVSSLTAGTYTVTVSDSQSCTATATATITQPTALSVSNSVTDVSCNGESNGSININVSGGVSPYTYSWNGGATTEDRTGLAAGTYSVTATDASGCTVSALFNVTQPTALSFNETHTDVTCNGGSNGSINITVSGGTPGYTYDWGGSVTTEDRTGLAAGTFNVTATDSKGCSVTGSATISQPTAINISEAVTDATCSPGNNGEINLTISGGTSPYTFLWNDGNTSQNRTTLFAGTYTVTVTDNIGCTSSKAISVTQIGIGMSLTTTSANVSCNGGSNGAIDLTVIGGNPPINYNWNGGAATEDRTGLAPGNYSVTVTDGLGCSAIANATITQPTAVSISVSKTDVKCFGESTGSITTVVSGGTSGYTYSWSNGAATPNNTSIPAGTYSVTVSDANSCSATASSIVLNQPASAINLSATPSNVLCFGQNNGSVDLTVSGGTAGYTYSWSNGSIGQDLSNVVSGTYNVTVTDANACTATATATVSQPASALSVSLAKTNLTCNGNNSGTITTTVSGGTTAYTFLWNDGNTSQDRIGLAAGTHRVTVTDNNSCSASASVSVTQPAAINITSALTHVSCNGGNNGAINITVSGGTSAYSFDWGGGITTEDRTGLSAGIYTVTVTDANLCTATHSRTITEPSALTLTFNSGTSVCASATGTATANTNNTGSAPYTYLWSNGGTTKTITGLPPETFTVSITDANGCSISGSVTVGLSGNNTDASFTVAGNYCAPNAAVVFTHTGSNNTTSHTWDFGNGDTASFTNPTYVYPASGTFTVTHIVTRGFCADTVSNPVTLHQKPILSSTVTNVSCNGGSNGAIDLTVTGSPAFTYSWTGGATTQDISGLSIGSYTVTVSDANSCSSTLTDAITQPPVIVITNTNTNVTCNGGNNGGINVAVIGGIPGYTYDWGGGITTQNRTGLTGGTYDVTVTDANLCTSTKSISVYQPNAINIVSAATNISCNGFDNGSINLTVTGGTGVYNFDWSNGATTQNISSLSPTTYNVTVTDANSCSASASAVITQPATLSISLTSTDVMCFGANSGSINTSTAGGTPLYSYTWNDGDIQINRSLLAAGNYSVTVTDQNLCSASVDATITQPATAVTIAVNSTSTISCYGDSTGTINITASGGMPAYTYLWSDNSNLEDRTNMLGGTYFVSATDQNGCVATASATINQPIAPVLIDTIEAIDVLCFGNAEGSLTATVTGGTGTLTFLWSNGATTQDLTNVVAGTYTLTASDANSCSTSAEATINEPTNVLAASISSTSISCFGGNNGDITLTVNGGVIPYTFLWNDADTNQNRTGLTAGTYSVVVTDSNGCSVSASETITQPASALNATVASTTNVSCFGENNGSINLSVSGGTTAYSFLWNDGVATQNRTGLSAGNYDVTVTDVNACSASTSATITEPSAALNIDAITATDVLCYGAATGSLTTTVSGGTTSYSFIWNDGGTTQNRTNIGAGSYNVTVTDVNNCSVSASATISQPATALSVSVSSTTNVSCFGGNNGAIDLAVNNGTMPYSFIWNDGNTSQNRTALSAGNYNVTVTDGNNCSALTDTTITEPSAALAVSLSVANVLCNGTSTGNITTAVSGGSSGYSYTWSNAAVTPNLNNISTGNYSLTVNDANGCSVTDSTVITEPTALNVTFTKTDASCYSTSTGSADLTVSGGTTPYGFLWSSGATTEDISNVAANTYDVTVTDANGCSALRHIVIGQPAQIELSTIAQNATCDGYTNGAVYSEVTGGATPLSYSWNNGETTANIQNVGAGNYVLSITDGNGCSVSASAVVIAPPPVYLEENHRNQSCNGASDAIIYLSVSGGTPSYQFAWSNTDTTQNIFNAATETYGVTVQDANGCSATLGGIVITEPAALDITLTATPVACAGENMGGIDATVTGGTPAYNYAWSNGSTNEDLTNVFAGIYFFTVTDANSCSATASTEINTLPQLSVNGTPDELPCQEATGGIDLTVDSGALPYTFLWSNGATTEDLTNVNPGIYSVIVRDGNGCSFDTTFEIVNQNTFNVNVDASGNTTITLGQTVDLHASSTSSSSTSFTWTPATGMDCPTCADVTVQPARTTTYTVIGIDTNGCISEDTVTVNIIEDHTVFTPNAFTPNGDGNNDYLQFFGNTAGVQSFNVMIFDRWGEKVFESEDVAFRWDGIYKGEPLPPAVYVYIMRVVFIDGYSEKILKGSVTLIR